MEPNGRQLLMMTRWNVDDLAGRLLNRMEAGGDKWEVISLPALAEDHDPLGRDDGEALWPERYPKEVRE